ncbi:serine protease [Streptomyces sp. NPDC000594]|uniref:serine protease n=1 Tax=Streptomyces sp. NPDC000594 TaxID=3154261 RepID=UPI0033221735
MARGWTGWLVAGVVGVLSAAGLAGGAGTASAAPPPVEPPVALVVGGTEAPENAYPYQVSLQVQRSGGWFHTCGGSIIGARWVLTAAHCLGIPAGSMRVMVGTNSLAAPTLYRTVYPVAEAIGHEDYNGGAAGMPNDIALLKLSAPIHFNPGTQPIALQDLPDVPRGSAVLTGWGRVSAGGGRADILRQATVTVLPIPECRLRWPGANLSPVNHLCTHDGAAGPSACNGDSGGPLARNGRLIGVVSWGPSTCSGSYPSVYTNAGGHRLWIAGKTGI